mmetsp:Transcript_25697/g.22714  ORF Transcript_25697/g.22714 Transcript_25697/m.22714 type:complete len:149 (+) Transcript_25697:489-935(+)
MPRPDVEAGEVTEIDENTLFTNFEDYENENRVTDLQDLVGIVRRGEKPDYLGGHVNNYSAEICSTVDLEYMTRRAGLYKTAHPISTETAYIERIVTEDELNESAIYPLPSTTSNFVKPYLTPERHLTYASFWGLTAGLGFVSMLRYML